MFTGWWVSAAKAGAAIASTTMITMTARAIIETLSERSRRQVSCHWVRPWTGPPPALRLLGQVGLELRARC